jgi:hypothetical protein
MNSYVSQKQSFWDCDVWHDKHLDLKIRVLTHNFLQHVILIINVVSASPKCNDELLANQAAEIEREIELGELDTGKGANQIGSLQRPGDTSELT